MEKIPKIIHYFYDNIPIWEKNRHSQVRMCFFSWKKKCPDYEFMLWHDGMPEFKEIIETSPFAKKAYELKLWAFVADYIRVYALYKYGGIYVDTDVQLLKNFDEFLDNGFFTSVESDILYGENTLEPAVMGAQAGHPLLKEALKIYQSDEVFEEENFISGNILKKALNKFCKFDKINYDGSLSEELLAMFYNKNIRNQKITDYGVYRAQSCFCEDFGIKIYPSEYFCPAWNAFGSDSVTENTVAIHWNQSSWWDGKKVDKLTSLKYKEKYKQWIYLNRMHILRLLEKLFPETVSKYLK